MTDQDLCFFPATLLVQMIRAKQVSPVEVMQAIINRVERLEPKINAFAYFDGDRALDRAKVAEAQLARGEAQGALFGLPVTIKDLAVTGDMPTERGSWIEKGNQPDTDAPFVQRLKMAGAIPLGKTTTSEFGWKGVSQSPLTGITHNPWAHGLNAGASSAGAGAAAAAGYGPLHQGSDGAGSVRMPAHFCGIFGLKPSFGRVPNWPVPSNDQTSHIGPMTRTVADSALMMETISGPHPWDHYSLESPPSPYVRKLDGASVKGLRVAWSSNLGHARVDSDVAALAEAGAKVFENMGARVEEVTPSWGPQGPELIRFFWAAHELGYQKFLPEWRDKMDPGLVACIESAANHSAADYVAMRVRKLAYVEAIHRFFEDYDLLLTPAVSVAAFPADRLMPEDWPDHPWDWVQWAEFSYPFNMSHNPAASIPCGFTEKGLPVGLQIVGPRMRDLAVLQASAAFEAASPWADRVPEI
ncbi:MAG: amidase family protein [Rhodospirillales bacterium]|jgi:aspartyl-tRNA(Asn)/glutamyl-tRNA(Gln) amidotransferase subunit A